MKDYLVLPLLPLTLFNSSFYRKLNVTPKKVVPPQLKKSSPQARNNITDKVLVSKAKTLRKIAAELSDEQPTGSETSTQEPLEVPKDAKVSRSVRTDANMTSAKPAKVLDSNSETASTRQNPKVQADNKAPVMTDKMEELVTEAMGSFLKSTPTANQPDVETLKCTKLVPKVQVELKDTAKVSKPENVLASKRKQPAKHPQEDTKVKPTNQKTLTFKTSQWDVGPDTAETTADIFSSNPTDPPQGLQTTKRTPQTSVNALLHVYQSSESEAETKTKQSTLETMKLTENAKDAEPAELRVTGISEPMEAQSSSECKEKNLTHTKTTTNKSSKWDVSPSRAKITADTSSSKHQGPQTTSKSPQTSVEVPSQVQRGSESAPESTARRPETKTETLPKQQLAAGSSSGAAVEAKKTVEGAATETKQQGRIKKC